MQQIADETGGTCTRVPGVADLPDFLPGVIASELIDLTLQVDGGPGTPITNTTPPLLPEQGPASVAYTTGTGPNDTHTCTVDFDDGDSGTAVVTVVVHLPAEAFAIAASLLGGLISITKIESTCEADADGVTRTSRVGTINGIEIGSGSGSITIPLVATVYFNETTTNAEGQLVQNAIRVQTLLGQEIILASCRLG